MPLTPNESKLMNTSQFQFQSSASFTFTFQICMADVVLQVAFYSLFEAFFPFFWYFFIVFGRLSFRRWFLHSFRSNLDGIIVLLVTIFKADFLRWRRENGERKKKQALEHTHLFKPPIRYFHAVNFCCSLTTNQHNFGVPIFRPKRNK